MPQMRHMPRDMPHTPHVPHMPRVPHMLHDNGQRTWMCVAGAGKHEGQFREDSGHTEEARMTLAFAFGHAWPQQASMNDICEGAWTRMRTAEKHE